MKHKSKKRSSDWISKHKPIPVWHIDKPVAELFKRLQAKKNV